MNNPYISVAIPAFKGKYLKDAIQSVLDQDYPYFELIIVNDHSPENLDIIINTFHDNRIRYYKNSHNLGKKSIALNWNLCLDYARYSYFTLLCDDDLMDPSFLFEMINLSRNYPQCSIFKSGTIRFGKGRYIESEDFPIKENYAGFLNNKIEGKRSYTIPEFFFKTEVIKKCGGYVPFPMGFYSDSASILNIIKESGYIVTSPKKLIRFRLSEEHISSDHNYCYEKAKAAICYYNWSKNRLNKSQLKKLKKTLESDVVWYYKNALSLSTKIKILFVIPFSFYTPFFIYLILKNK